MKLNMFHVKHKFKLQQKKNPLNQRNNETYH